MKKEKKIKTSIKFSFEEQDEIFPDFNIDLEIKSKGKIKDTKIKKHNYNKNKIKDVSSKLI